MLKKKLVLALLAALVALSTVPTAGALQTPCVIWIGDFACI